MRLGAKRAAKIISTETMTAGVHVILTQLQIGIHTMSRQNAPGVKNGQISFLSILYVSPLFPTFPWVQTVKWGSDSSGIGGEQQASISECRRGAFTELPSLHLASPQSRLGRQLQLSAYWVWQHKYWLSAAIVSLHTIMEMQTGIHAQRHFSISLHFTLYLILPPALSLLSLCVRLTTEILSVAESLLLVFTVLSLCQSHPNASDACRACPLCAYACVVCTYVALCLCVQVCVL